MVINWFQAALLGIFACLASMPGMGGSSIGNYTLGRPLVGGLICGIVLGDIPTKRGIPMGMDMTAAGTAIIKGRFPYAEVVHYGKDLRSMSRGTGEFTIDVNGYQQVPADEAKKLIDAYHASRES